ncbi:MAG: hypothetical protein JXA18_02535 [Chitinispirillaceae bacterium]|nr:hypothetical protein [Chitinispirillaceae bacterium]
MLKRSLLPLTFVILAFLRHDAASDTPSVRLFWEDQIDTALSIRNEAFGNLITESAGIDMTTWNSIVRQTVETVLFTDQTRVTTWDSFIRGMLLSLKGDTTAKDHFERSLAAAENDPGTTWLLFIEFDRYNLRQWGDRALMQLEKQLFAAGGSSAEIISRQLIHYGFVDTKSRNMDKALYHFIWAHRFNPHEAASIIQRTRTVSPLQFITVMKAGLEILPVLRSSWRAQLSFFNFWYSFFRRAVFIFIICITTAVSIKYFPAALHQFAHRYPVTVGLSLRTMLASGITVSFVAFGLFPFLWFLSFLLCRYCSRPERLLLGFALAGVVLAPLDAAVMDRLYRAVDPAGPVMRLSRSINEGRPPPSVTSPGAASRATPLNNRAAQLSAALNALKRFAFTEADSLIKPLSLAYPDDPVAANLNGILFFLNGSIDSAAGCFKSVVQKHPRDIVALFNLSQCLMRLNDATAGMDLLKTAGQLQPRMINRFLHDNDRYFIDEWPPLRQVLFPDYSPLQFWKWFFIPSAADDSLWRALWGLSFLGIPPGISFFLFLLLSASLFVMQGINRSKLKPRRLFACKYCGRIICRQCSTGVLCTGCVNRTQLLKGSMTLERSRESTIATFSHLAGLRNAVLNLLFPGSGALLEIKPRYLQATLTCAASSIVYAWWYSLANGRYFSWLASTEIVYFFSIPCAYNAYHVIRYAPRGIRHCKSLLRLHFGRERSTDDTQRNTA